MAKGYKTGGRQKGTTNKDTALKNLLRIHSTAYYEPSQTVHDPELADALGVQIGTIVSRFEIDLSAMRPAERAAIHEKLLHYHQPQMQSVSADLSVDNNTTALEDHLTSLCIPPKTPDTI